MEKEYAMVFIDGIRFKVKEENRLVEKSVYIVMGYTLEGQKDVLGFWIGESESAKYWMQILNDLKLRGVQEIFIISSDNLTGISNAIKAVFPKTQIQKCVVHQIRNSVKFVNYKDLKEFTKDMKNIYREIILMKQQDFYKFLKISEKINICMPLKVEEIILKN
ncbi:transposase [Mycoplasmopsis felis]|nr:transposase [Mycoplasmopsis felis]